MGNTFLEIASAMIERGVPVIPLEPRDKKPFLPNWHDRGTTDIETVTQWNNLDDQFNCGSLATPDGNWYLDCDDPNLPARIEQETGQKMPCTLTVKSRKGLHYYFKQNDASRRMGNRSLPELFDAQVYHKQVVSPGSTHPTGIKYEIIVDAPIVEAPGWLIEWISDQTMPEKKSSDSVLVSEDFDFDAFCEHYEIATIGNGPWYFTPVCPYKGDTHEQSKLTGFYFDGSSFGFHCFAAGCGNPSVGEVIKRLNETHQPYPGVIWEEEDDDYWDDMVEEDEPDPLPKKPVPIFLNNDPLPAEPATPAKAVEAPQSQQETDPLAFPEDALYGEMGRLAKQMKMPLGLAYPALLGCYSSIPELDEMGDGCRINLYVALIAHVGGGKDTAIRRAREILNLEPGKDWKSLTLASDRGLMNVIGDTPIGGRKSKEREPGPSRMLLIANEMSLTIKKAAIDNSTLAGTLNVLWDQNEYEVADKNGIQSCDCRLSWVGGIPVKKDDPSEFSNIFGRETTNGLLDRMILGYSGTRFNYKPWTAPSVAVSDNDDYTFTGEVEATAVTKVDPEAQALYDELFDLWKDNDASGRLRFNLMKVACLTASCNQDGTVTLPCMQAAVRFFEWQIKLREVFAPGIAENTLEAKFAEVAMKEFIRAGGLDKDISWKRIAHDLKWSDRFGDRLVANGIKNMIETGRIYPIDVTDDDSGKTKKSKHRIRVRKFRKPDTAYPKNPDLMNNILLEGD